MLALTPLAALALSGVGRAAPTATPRAEAALRDPWEHRNRRMFAFGMKLDRALIAPLAHGYRRAAPPALLVALGRMIHNLDEPRIAGNDLLQGHPRRAATAGGRFVLNATLGVGGLLDPAGRLGLRRHEADFGQTLGRYGVPPGPYGFMPLLGPGDVRDGVGGLVDTLADPLPWATGGLFTAFGRARRWSATAQARVDADGQLIAIQRDFTDPYAALRSAYSQQRAQKVRDARGEATDAAVQQLPDFAPAASTPDTGATPP